VHTDINVVLLGGTYRLAHTLAFDSAKGDSAPAGHTVTYEAAPGADPVLSGGEQVSGWTQTAGGIWEANVPAGTDTRQLYVNGVRANRASGSVPVSLTETATGYTASSTTWTAGATSPTPNSSTTSTGRRSAAASPPSPAPR
jgi:hypothetical protein